MQHGDYLDPFRASEEVDGVRKAANQYPTGARSGQGVGLGCECGPLESGVEFQQELKRKS
jgi:hypothetical protein